MREAIDTTAAEWPQAVGSPVAEEEIQAAEERLRFRFPVQYRQFVARYGAAIVGGEGILGLRTPAFLSEQHSSVVEATEFWRSSLPQTAEWLVFETDGGGNPIGFRPQDDRVWAWDHDFGGLIEIASDFESYLKKALRLDVGNADDGSSLRGNDPQAGE